MVDKLKGFFGFANIGNLDYEGYLNSTIQSNRIYPINFYSMYSFRNECLSYINQSNIRIKKMQGNIEKHQRIVDGIKLI